MAGRLGYLLAGVVAYLVFLAAGLPADFVLQRLDPPAGLSWSRAGGTVWAGTLHRVSFRGGGVEEVAWRLRPWRLVLGQVGASVRLEAPGLAVTGSGRVNLFSRDVELSDVHGEAEGGGLARALALPVSLAGTFTLDLERLALPADGAPAGSGGLDWRAAGVVLGAGLSLGNVRAALDGSRVQLTASGGEIDGDGRVELTAGPGYDLDLVLRPSATARPETVSLLKSLAPPQPDGSQRLRRRGSL